MPSLAEFLAQLPPEEILRIDAPIDLDDVPTALVPNRTRGSSSRRCI